jgi:hypothetical protein
MARDWKTIAANRLTTIKRLQAADKMLRENVAQRIEKELFIALHQRCISQPHTLAQEVAEQVARNL